MFVTTGTLVLVGLGIYLAAAFFGWFVGRRALKHQMKPICDVRDSKFPETPGKRDSESLEVLVATSNGERRWRAVH